MINNIYIKAMSSTRIDSRTRTNSRRKIILLATTAYPKIIWPRSRNGRRVTWGKAPRFGDDLSLTYLFASTSEKSYMYVTNDMLSIY